MAAVLTHRFNEQQRAVFIINQTLFNQISSSEITKSCRGSPGQDSSIIVLSSIHANMKNTQIKSYSINWHYSVSNHIHAEKCGILTPDLWWRSMWLCHLILLLSLLFASCSSLKDLENFKVLTNGGTDWFLGDVWIKDQWGVKQENWDVDTIIFMENACFIYVRGRGVLRRA